MVDIENPENNREFIVYDLGQKLNGVGAYRSREYFGYMICLEADVRWVYDDQKTMFWQAKVHSSNAVLVKAPAWDYDHMNGRDALAGRLSQPEVDAIDNAHDEYVSAPESVKNDRFFKYYLLTFPSRYQLTSKPIYDEAGEDQKLPWKLVPILKRHSKMSKDGLRHFMCWNVAREDVKSRKTGKSDLGEKQSELAQTLAGLDMGDYSMGGGQSDDDGNY